MGITPKDPANFDPTMGNYKDLKPFRFWCQKVLPLVYDDSLSYYEVLCKVVDYLNKAMEDIGVLHDDVDALHTAYQQLQSYVNDYFSTLDVQEEINNKLDVMAEDGTLDALLLPYFNAYKTEINSIVAEFETEVNNDINGFKTQVNTTMTNQNQRITTQDNNISVLQGRMDGFSRLTEGSTTGDAELADIRVGTNGETYPTAGDAVRGQINLINNVFKNAIDGYYLDANGELVADSNYMVSDFIELTNPGDYITWTYGSNFSSNARAFVYQSNKTTKVEIEPIIPLTERTDIIYASSYVYIRISIKKANANITRVAQNNANIYTNPNALMCLKEIGAEFVSVDNNFSDIATGINGEKYATAGDAVREQIGLIENGIKNGVDGYYLDENGALVEDSDYMVSDFIPLINAGSNIIWIYGNNFDSIAHACIYKSDKLTSVVVNAITSTDRRTDIVYSAEYIYFRISVKKSNSNVTQVLQGSTVLYENPFPYLSVNELDENMSVVNKNIFEVKNAIDGYYLDENGELVEDSDYMVSDFVKLTNPGDYITWRYGYGLDDRVKGFMYKSDKATKSIINPITNVPQRADLRYTDTYTYIRISVKKSNASVTKIIQNNVDIYSNPSDTDGVNSKVHKMIYYNNIRVLEYNVRNYLGATAPDSPDPLTPEQIAYILPKMKEVLNKHRPDIMIACEDQRIHFDGSIGDATGTKELPVYETLYEHYFPYYYRANYQNFGGPTIYSKYPILELGDILPDYHGIYSRRKISYAILDYMNTELCVIGCHAEPGSTEDITHLREYYFEAIVDKISDYDYALIVGDTNIQNVSELEVFTDAGVVLGNAGYFGDKKTHVDVNEPIDNIMTKGFTINNFDVSTDEVYSDHYPCFSSVNVRM